MTCDGALDRMLEADPAELSGNADTELARHIAGCDRCAAAAGAMLEELDALDRGLAELAGGGPDAPTDANAAADAALAVVRAESDTGGAGATEAGADIVAIPRWARHTWIPLAAAAALAGILVFGQIPEPFPAGGPTGPTIETPPDPRVSVTPPADRGAAIMETENPNITIVWLYEREET